MTQLTEDGSKTDARQIVCTGLKRLVVGSGLAAGEKELKAWFKEALELSYSGAWRKLAGEAAWEERDLQKVAHGLGISFEDLLLSLSCGGGRVETAKVEIAGMQTFAKIVLGDPFPKGTHQGLVAYELNDEWHVADASRSQPAFQSAFYRVLSLSLAETVERKPVFALIDDEGLVTETASALLQHDGINSKCFSDERSFLQDLDKIKFDAYIVDWFLSDDPAEPEQRTAEELIHRIRESEYGKTAPIVIVTGKNKTDSDVVVDDLSRVSDTYNCTPMIKPVLWRFVGGDLVRRIKEEAVKNSI